MISNYRFLLPFKKSVSIFLNFVTLKHIDENSLLLPLVDGVVATELGLELARHGEVHFITSARSFAVLKS
jgi:hypothetical protein